MPIAEAQMQYCLRGLQERASTVVQSIDLLETAKGNTVNSQVCWFSTAFANR